MSPAVQGGGEAGAHPHRPRPRYAHRSGLLVVNVREHGGFPEGAAALLPKPPNEEALRERHVVSGK